ncbi:transcription initiation factor TFIID subunit 8-like [Pistacia vera]|uniref:transcription initiation factor TFIID subunit 8-like n=1 Tax=Pistacia vera TaxID=55513 RepID=UPI001263D754|nr:transcription initiation factor TFIID subunit 8-like [Pistacia vera]XP_031249180.1 transcription initiation factor TFIID subunit 8-like [Pistacia vera]
MSDGGGESGSKHEQSHGKRKSDGDDFAQAIAKIAVAQVCERVGFQTFQQSALGTLSEIAVRYIHHIGKTAHFYANLAGRTEVNAFDIFQGLEDLGSTQGFLGASDIDHCLTSSGVVRELIQYVNEVQEIPFAYSIPRFPVVKDRKLSSSFLQIGEEPPDEHIPAWLPAFPDPQTYLQLPTRNGRETDSETEKIELGRQQRKMEMSMLNLQQQFSGSGPQGPSSVAHGDNPKDKQAAESNPFLSEPLHFEEKEVSSVAVPAKLSKEVASKTPVAENCGVVNHVSVLQTFAPAIEAMKNKLCDSEEEQEKVLMNQRPAVQFKIGLGKKSLSKPLKLGPQHRDVEMIAPWFCKDVEKDEKKRRAEKILKDSMENTQELAQL